MNNYYLSSTVFVITSSIFTPLSLMIEDTSKTVALAEYLINDILHKN